MLSGTEETDTIKDLVSKGAKKIVVPNMITLSEEDLKNNSTYYTLIRAFIDEIKAEVY